MKFADDGTETIVTKLVKGRSKADVFGKKQKGGGANLSKSWVSESPEAKNKKVVKSKKKVSFRKWL